MVQKYQLYHQVKLINMNIILVRKYCLNQQQIIKQAKCTYFPLGKAFEKQIKTIEDQGEKQIKAFQDKRPIKEIEKFTYDINDSPIVLKEKEI